MRSSSWAPDISKGTHSQLNALAHPWQTQNLHICYILCSHIQDIFLYFPKFIYKVIQSRKWSECNRRPVPLQCPWMSARNQPAFYVTRRSVVHSGGVVRAEKVPDRLPVLTTGVDAPCSVDWFHSYGHTTQATFLPGPLFWDCSFCLEFSSLIPSLVWLGIHGLSDFVGQ